MMMDHVHMQKKIMIVLVTVLLRLIVQVTVVVQQ